jgi:zinc transport system substrate-binding protein
MKRLWRLAGVFLALAWSVGAEGADTLKVLAGTSLVEDIVLDLTARRAVVATIIPGSSCPGHMDLKPTDMVFAASADIVLVHPFQTTMPQVQSLLAAANPRQRVEALLIRGAWTIPSVQDEATRRIGQILSALRPAWSADLQQRTAVRLGRLAAARTQAAQRLAPLTGQAVLAAAMQAEFLRWAGLTVVREYGRAEDLTPRDLAGLMDAARGKRIAGIVDNLQSGAEAGRPLADDLRVPHVVLSNFPGSLPGADDYFGLLEENVRRLLELAAR